MKIMDSKFYILKKEILTEKRKEMKPHLISLCDKLMRMIENNFKEDVLEGDIGIGGCIGNFGIHLSYKFVMADKEHFNSLVSEYNNDQDRNKIELKDNVFYCSNIKILTHTSVFKHKTIKKQINGIVHKIYCEYEKLLFENLNYSDFIIFFYNHINSENNYTSFLSKFFVEWFNTKEYDILGKTYVELATILLDNEYNYQKRKMEHFCVPTFHYKGIETDKLFEIFIKSEYSNLYKLGKETLNKIKNEDNQYFVKEFTYTFKHIEDVESYILSTLNSIIMNEKNFFINTYRKRFRDGCVSEIKNTDEFFDKEWFVIDKAFFDDDEPSLHRNIISQIYMYHDGNRYFK